jgi:Rieske 2Fe-2S family protein
VTSAPLKPSGTAASASLAAALAGHRPGHALSREFHTDAGIHAAELEAIWRRSWLFAGPSAAAPAPGDFFRFDLGDDSIVVVRLEDGTVAAVHNTCRHRGMPVCPEPAGNARRWVCPYHQWSYALDGRLLGAGGSERELDLSGLDLLAVPVVEIGGLIFLWAGVGSAPDPLGDAARELGAALAHQGLDHARVAHRIDYRVDANWKLIWENNRECWHCHVGHPEYVTANFDSAPDTARVRELSAARAAEHAALLEAVATDAHAEPGLYRFPTPGRWWSANRTPLRPGFVTESLDGAPVASLMGDHPDYDVGTLRVRTVPNFWSHASADHAVLTRLLPDGPDHTQISVYWLVDADADCDLARMLPFWQLTSEQDWALCEANHAGVRSPAYRPGPYSPSREYNVIAFVDWYLERMSRA